MGVDCAPVLTKDSSDAFWRDSIYQHKYGSCCFKIQLGINFLGWIVLYTGLHLGTKTDDVIFEETADSHPFEWWEWWIGDAAYDRCAGVVCRFVQAADSVLEAWQVFWNKDLNRPRQRGAHHGADKEPPDVAGPGVQELPAGHPRLH